MKHTASIAIAYLTYAIYEYYILIMYYQMTYTFTANLWYNLMIKCILHFVVAIVCVHVLFIRFEFNSLYSYDESRVEKIIHYMMCMEYIINMWSMHIIVNVDHKSVLLTNSFLIVMQLLKYHSLIVIISILVNKKIYNWLKAYLNTMPLQQYDIESQRIYLQ